MEGAGGGGRSRSWHIWHRVFLSQDRLVTGLGSAALKAQIVDVGIRTRVHVTGAAPARLGLGGHDAVH